MDHRGEGITLFLAYRHSGLGEETDYNAHMIRLLPGVNAHVALERLKVAEVCPTDLAGVRLLSCVN